MQFTLNKTHQCPFILDKTTLKSIYNSDLTMLVTVSGVISDNDKTPAKSILSIPKDSDESGIVINTAFMYDIESGNIKEVNPEDSPWLMNTKSIEMQLASYPADAVKSIVNAMKPVRGYFESKPVRCVNSLSSDEQACFYDNKKIKDLFSELRENYQIVINDLKEARLANSNIGIHDFIERYSFKKHIMIMGPKGLGKTYLASKWLNDNKIPQEFLSGHSGIESIDMLGYYIKNDQGNLVWMDGPLTAAFRVAQYEPSALFIDEILRIPAKELNILVGALTPDNNNNYRLRTNRIIEAEDGIAKSEVITVPASNFWAISTTNIGAEYQVEDMDLALTDRFRLFEMQPSEDAIRMIINSVNQDKFSETTITAILQLYSAVNDLVTQRQLTYPLNVRYICEIISLCDNKRKLKSYLFDLIPNVCSMTTDGNINEVEKEIFKDTIKRLIK